MPRIGAELERRQALILAAIKTIGEHGSLEVSVKEIAREAGMSSALAFHYFRGKDEIIVETMRHLLRELSNEVVAGLKEADDALQRIDSIIKASFSMDQFDRNTIAAWLVFYLKAYSSPQAARLLAIYNRRLKSNLLDAASHFFEASKADDFAEALGALIDGIYIREALVAKAPDSEKAIKRCRQFVQAFLAQYERHSNQHGIQ